MRSGILAACLLSTLALLQPFSVLAQDAPAGDTVTVETTYAVPTKRGAPPVYAIGFYIGFGRYLNFDADLRGAIDLDGIVRAYEVFDADTDKPGFRIDFDGDGNFSEAEQIEEYEYRMKGYVRAKFGFPEFPGRVFDLTVRLGEGQASCAINDRGAAKGVLTLQAGAETRDYDLYLFDANISGRFDDDFVYIDFDRDGQISSIERFRKGDLLNVEGACVRVGETRKDGSGLDVEILAQADPAARDIVAELNASPLPGNDMPPFEFVDQNGATVSNKDLPGKVTLINFWGSW